MEPKILKEEKDYIVINKPAGLVVHSDGRTDERTLCDWILKKYPETKDVGESFNTPGGETISRPGIVHRLDRDTSGVIIVARTQKGFEYFKKLFQEREIEKKYHTFVYGNIKEEEGVIDAPIGRSKKNFKQWFAGLKTRGKTRDAVTRYTVLERSANKDVTFIEVAPKTGRTHQIRVHLKSIYHPIVADALYAPDRESPLSIQRTALHARTIFFKDWNDQIVSIEAPYPEDFQKALESFKNLA